MAFICLSVVLDGQLVFPWNISSLQPGLTFLSFYEQIRAGSTEKFQECAAKLQHSKLGQAFFD